MKEEPYLQYIARKTSGWTLEEVSIHLYDGLIQLNGNALQQDLLVGTTMLFIIEQRMPTFAPNKRIIPLWVVRIAKRAKVYLKAKA